MTDMGFHSCEITPNKAYRKRWNWRPKGAPTINVTVGCIWVCDFCDSVEFDKICSTPLFWRHGDRKGFVACRGDPWNTVVYKHDLQKGR